MRRLTLSSMVPICLSLFLLPACTRWVLDNNPQFSITNAAPPDGCQGVSYEFAFVAQIDQWHDTTPPTHRSTLVADATWGVSGGSLPDGLGLNRATGALSGTPSRNGTYTFEIEATAPTGENYLEEYTVRIGTLTIRSATPLTPFCPGQPYSYQLDACGASGTLTWTLADRGNLPNAIVLSTAGVLSGNMGPNDKGPFVFRVRVVDSTSLAIDEKEFTLERGIGMNDVYISAPFALPRGWTDASYGYEFAVCSGTPLYALTVVSGSLPQGIAPVANTNSIAGTPCRTETRTFVAQIADSAAPQNIPWSTHMIEIAASPLAFTSPTASDLPQANECQAGYTVQFAATGGSGSCAGKYVWASPNGLPPGFSLDSATGLLSVLPVGPTITPHALDVAVADTAVGQQQMRSFSLAFAESPTASPELRFLQVRQIATNQISLSGGGPSRLDFYFDAQAAPTLYNAVQNWNTALPISGLVTAATLQVVGGCTQITQLDFTGPADRNADGILDVTARFDEAMVTALLAQAGVGAGQTATLRLRVTAVYEQQTYNFTAKLAGIAIVQ